MLLDFRTVFRHRNTFDSTATIVLNRSPAALCMTVVEIRGLSAFGEKLRTAFGNRELPLRVAFCRSVCAKAVVQCTEFAHSLRMEFRVFSLKLQAPL